MLTVDTVRVGLLGFGTVGQSVARILCEGHVPRVELKQIFNRGVASKRVDWVPSSITWTEQIDDVLTSDVDVVVELVGGLHPAYEWVRAALLAGKSVVTANKQLIAHYGTELGNLARARGQQLRFEASVAGGIPVLRALHEGLAGDRLVEVRGILNGTCAYILSRMESAELPFADALAEAQAAGFAEADPTEDVDGADAAAKLAIVSAVGLRCPIRVGDIARQSIRAIESVDFQYAREIGCTIRQIARAAVQDDGRVFAVVTPALVPLNSSFGRIDGSQNVVTVRGVFGGETSFSGFGAGGAPTAVAVVSDLLSIRRQTGSSAAVDSAVTESAATPVHEVSNEFVAPHYVRFTVKDRPGILADIFAVFARHDINVEAVVQLPRYRKDRLPFVATLEACSSSVLNRALADIGSLDFHVEPPLALPILR
ncbi:MAG TPA: homoserine dehydrogenase [Vicinamibacterales bacterium]|jgi:homoserine dehydrogenase|nr:homoserine dehydrogenase [Vicinamibacterales bacterium]